MIIYYNVDQKRSVDALGGVVSAAPLLEYMTFPEWEFHFVRSGNTPVDLSDALAWRVSLDKDYLRGTDPMIRTYDVDASRAAEGIIIVSLDTNTPRFGTAVDGVQKLDTTLEFWGAPASGRNKYYFPLPVTVKNAVDPLAGDPTEPASLWADKLYVTALVNGVIAMLAGVVRSICGKTPDADGAVALDIADLSDAGSVITGLQSAIGTKLNQSAVDARITALAAPAGYVPTGMVKSVNGAMPDASGNVTITVSGDGGGLTESAIRALVEGYQYAKTVNGVAPDASGNVAIAIGLGQSAVDARIAALAAPVGNYALLVDGKVAASQLPLGDTAGSVFSGERGKAVETLAAENKARLDALGSSPGGSTNASLTLALPQQPPGAMRVQVDISETPDFAAVSTVDSTVTPAAVRVFDGAAFQTFADGWIPIYLAGYDVGIALGVFPDVRYIRCRAGYRINDATVWGEYAALIMRQDGRAILPEYVQTNTLTDFVPTDATRAPTEAKHIMVSGFVDDLAIFNGEYQANFEPDANGGFGIPETVDQPSWSRVDDSSVVIVLTPDTLGSGFVRFVVAGSMRKEFQNISFYLDPVTWFAADAANHPDELTGVTIEYKEVVE